MRAQWCMKENAGEDRGLHPLEHGMVLHCRVVGHGVVVYSIREHLLCLRRHGVVLQGSLGIGRHGGALHMVSWGGHHKQEVSGLHQVGEL